MVSKLPKSKRLAAESSLRWRSYGWLALNTLCWGAALIIVKPAFETTTPFRFLLYRFGLAAIFSLPILAFYFRRLSMKTLLTATRKVIPVEMLGTVVALFFLYFGLDQTTAIEASLLTTTQPIFVTLGGVWLLKEVQERHEWLGLGLAFLGALVITVGPEILNHSGDVSLFGNTLILIYLALNAIYFPTAKRLYAKLPKFLVTTLSFYVGATAFFLLSILESGSVAAFLQAAQQDFTSQAVWFSAGYMAIFGSIIGLTAYIKGQDGIEASEASLFWYLQPLIYIPLGLLVLGESISTTQWLGLGLVLAGVFWAERRFTKKS